MKKLKFLLGIAVIAIAGLFLISSDHADAPAVTGTADDITDLYAFAAKDTNNLVFVLNTQGLLSPGATASAAFSENVLLEIKIDNTGDNVEDLVIQAIRRGNKMYFFGPVAPGSKGASGMVEKNSPAGEVEITGYKSEPIIATNNGMKFFAGPRDDPFFFDLNQFKHIIAGTATGFNNPGTDTFAGTNVLATVIELPKSMLGSSVGKINVWAVTKQKQ